MSATSVARSTNFRNSSIRRAQTGTQMRALLSSFIAKPPAKDYTLRSLCEARRAWGECFSTLVSRAVGWHVEVARRAFGDAWRRNDLAGVARRQCARAGRRRDGGLRRDISRRGEPLFFCLQAEGNGD